MTWQPHVVICCRVFRTVVRRNCNPRFGASDFGPGACEPAGRTPLRTEMRLSTGCPRQTGFTFRPGPAPGGRSPGPATRRRSSSRPRAPGSGTPMGTPDPCGGPTRDAATPPRPRRSLTITRVTTLFFCVSKKLARATADPAGRYKQDREFIHCRGTGGRFVGPCGTEYRRRTRLRSSILRTVADRDRALANESARRHGAKRHLLTSRV